MLTMRHPVGFSLDHQSPSSSARMFTYLPSGRSPRTTPIVQAVYHHPLLVTLSQSFHLSLYDIGADSVTHTQTLSSFTSYPPSSLVLSTPSPTTYKLILAYAIPVYPAHWTVGATEPLISSPAMQRMTSVAASEMMFEFATSFCERCMSFLIVTESCARCVRMVLYDAGIRHLGKEDAERAYIPVVGRRTCDASVSVLQCC